MARNRRGPKSGSSSSTATDSDPDKITHAPPIAKKGDANTEVFDASKSAKIPRAVLSKPPKTDYAVRVGIVNNDIGFGLFAARDFKQGEYIFHENPFVEAPYNQTRVLNNPLAQGQVDALRTHPNASHSVDLIIAAYPAFSALWGFPPHPWNVAEPILSNTLGSHIVDDQGMLAQTSITEDQYDAYIARFLPAREDISADQARELAANFFRYYAFRGARRSNVNDVAATVDARIYLLASLMNHRCMPEIDLLTGQRPTHDAANRPIGPNCTFRIGPQGLAKFAGPVAIIVEARRDIAEGEELTWDYGKGNLSFRCMCEDCVKTPKGWCIVQ